MAKISWLHLSDLHFGADGDPFGQNVAIDAITADISARLAGETSLQFIAVTGDIAFSGKAREYETAADFFTSLAEALGVDLERIFAVPGNHDVDRGEKEYLYEGVRTLNSQISRRSITSWVANQIEPPCWKGRKHFAHFGINSPTMPLVAGRRMDLLASVVSSLGASGSVSWKAGYRPAPGASGTRDSLEDGTVLGVPAEEITGRHRVGGRVPV